MQRVETQFRRFAELAIDKAVKQGFAALDEKERLAYCVHTLEIEIATGGFRNYLWSAYADYADETVAALDKIGAAQTSRLLRQAFGVFPNDRPPKETFSRQRELMRANPRVVQALDRLDHQYWEQEENLAALAMTLIVASP